MTMSTRSLRPGSWRVCLAVLVILASGCPPEHDGADGDGGETGGVGDPDPIDPFDGEGADPPGDVNLMRPYPPPSSLGNGLVHDSRFDLKAESSKLAVSTAQLAAGVNWDSFVAPHRAKLRVGFRPTQVDADVRLNPGMNGNSILTIDDRSVYVSDDDANYRTETKTYVFSDLLNEQALSASGPSAPGQPRPTAIDSFALGAQQVGVHIVWTYDNSSLDWRMVVGQSDATFLATLANLAQSGFRPISISGRQRNGASEYAGIFVQDGVPEDDWFVMLGHNAMDLAAQVTDAWDTGYYPFRGSYQDGSYNLPLFDVLWIKRSPKLKLELRYNLDEALFEEQDKSWRTAGYHLESAAPYLDAGVTRYAGLWVQHEPYLRWTEGVEADPNDPIYIEQYLPLHEQAMQQMTLAGDAKAGEYFRPSTTLHLFKGADLVLNRAYTYAPAIYPSTPLNAPMALASASKSVTATAVVQLMNELQLPLTTPFAGLAGIHNVPAMVAGPSVLEVLRNLGGFEPLADSYGDHSLVDQSIYGAYPITGEMMYDYVLAGCGSPSGCSHLDAATSDDYWSSDEYSKAQQSGKMAYSNPGYTMLGELLRVLTGLACESYVRTILLEPLSLQQEIYADPGHRNAHRAPTKAGLGSYLINTRHPYRSGTTPLLGSEPVPQPANGTDASPRWSVNAGPIDGSAPATAAIERYAGKVFLGGAPLAAGGWVADGKSLGLLIYAIAQHSVLMPQPIAAQLWHPQWRNSKPVFAQGWSYGLGWWARGNWVAMVGGTAGANALAAHNTEHDFTVVYLSNVVGNGMIDVLNPLLSPVNGAWGTSTLGSQFPCVDDLTTFQNECFGALVAY